MATEVVMPRLSDSMEEGTVLKWLVQRGGEVKRGQPLVEIETDKANMTYDADSDGVLVEILAEEGETLEVGKPIARIGSADEAGTKDSDGGTSEEAGSAAPEDAAERAPTAEPSDDGAEREPTPVGDASEAEAPAPRPVAKANGGERLKASPVARRMAGELGVELARVEGSGPGGRVVKADVEAAAKEPAPATPPADGAGAAAAGEAAAASEQAAASEAQTAPPGAESPAAPEAAPGGAKGETTVQEPSRLQRTVSRRMAEAKATVPDFSLELDVDMTLCIELRERLKAQTDRAPSYNDMVVKAAALALRDHPRVNGAYRDGRFESYSRVNVGVAVAARDALVVPVIHG